MPAEVCKESLTPRLKLIGVEGVASLKLAALIAALEPTHALGRRAMGESVRHDIALRLFLDAIVADGARRVESLFDVAGLDDVLGLLGVIGPDAGKTVGLKLHAHLERIGLRLPHALAQSLDLIGDAQELLHVMADLVREDVGLGEVALYAEAVLQLLIKIEVDVNLLVARAVEGAHLRQPHAASRAHAA